MDEVIGREGRVDRRRRGVEAAGRVEVEQGMQFARSGFGEEADRRHRSHGHRAAEMEAHFELRELA